MSMFNLEKRKGHFNHNTVVGIVLTGGDVRVVRVVIERCRGIRESEKGIRTSDQTE